MSALAALEALVTELDALAARMDALLGQLRLILAVQAAELEAADDAAAVDEGDDA